MFDEVYVIYKDCITIGGFKNGRGHFVHIHSDGTIFYSYRLKELKSSKLCDELLKGFLEGRYR